ncbi:hypothetical protein [Chryseobacterium joostei]|uniref:hypothetical protein n=1 Tax=Chryseobacterium joostei TaxID=112234 RepID=UPI003D15141C
MKRTIILKIFFVQLILCLFVSCVKASDKKFLGYWIMVGDKYSEVIEIKEVGTVVYVKNRATEFPAEWDKAKATLSSELRIGSDNIPILIQLSKDPDKITLNTEQYSLDWVKISKSEAEKQVKKVDQYCNPDFFIGRWQRVDMEGTHEIKKKGDTYYYITDQYTKKMTYNAFNHILSCDLGVGILPFQRSGNNEIKAFGINTYRRISP